ncbi:MAG: cellulase family glycosylhydrolase [Fibrobacter sp.]|nr:cellulase family glycosylhydrolase [Fibrobacter sp.]
MIRQNGLKFTMAAKLRSALLLTVLSASLLFSVTAGYLTSKGSKLYNSNGQEVRLTGVNWFGFETTNFFPHGLWKRDYHGVLNQVKEMGFNCLRIPFCDDMLEPGATAKPGYYGEDPYYKRDSLSHMNRELNGLSPVEMMDEIIKYAGEIGIGIILDNHSRAHDGYMEEKLWYTAKISEEKWISNWVMLAKRYKDNPAVIAFDLNNEPHGKLSENGSTWGTGDEARDWNTAAEKCGNAILEVNPNVLIIVEGVQDYEGFNYWWGGNLKGVKDHPIKLSNPEKLVYSAHEYGPEVFQQDWFSEASFPDNMEAIWDEAFGFVVKDGIGPLFIGEFGIGNLNAYEGRAGTWFKTFLKYMSEYKFSFTFWSLNPNSGDTGGMLSDDWESPVTWKLDLVKPHLAPMLNAPTNTRKKISNVIDKKMQTSITNKCIAYNGQSSNVQISVIGLNGKVVAKTTNHTLDINNLANGVYTAVVSSNGNIVHSAKFTK